MACFGRKPTEFFCHVVLLDESEFPVEITKSTRGLEVLEKVYDHLNLLEKDYFGLRYIDKASQSRWLDPMKSVTKQMKAGPPYLMYFCIKFYASDPNKLHEELTRYLFFLQVKRDIFQGRLPCPQNTLAELSGYAIQSELGDFEYRTCTTGYVSEFRFITKQTEELEEKITDCHKRLIGIVPSVAEYMYLEKAKWLEMYGVDLHLVKGEDQVEYFVALKPAGVVVYNNKTAVGTYLWPKITKIDFKGKMFSLNVNGKESREYVYVFYLPNKAACKHLWKCCVEHHAFFRLDRVKPPSQAGTGLFRTGSGFRYSGRTQKEALEEGRRIARPDSRVKRKPSRRYERRLSQSNDRGHNNVTVRSTTQIQIKADEGQFGNSTSVKTDGRPTSTGEDVFDGSRQFSHAPALPWEELAQTQAGLYTPAPESPRSVRSTNSTGKSRKRSPKFPRPHHRRSGQSSGSETEPSRRRSRSAYFSDDDVGRRKRHHKRSHHRHAHSATEMSGSDGENLPSRRSRRRPPPNPPSSLFNPPDPEQIAQMGDSAPYHWDKIAGDNQDRAHHHHHHHHHASSERDARSDARSDASGRHRHSRSLYSEPAHPAHRSPAFEMVPALDVIQPRVAVQRVAKEGRQRHHRRHRNSHHGYQSSESLQSALSAPPAPLDIIESHGNGVNHLGHPPLGRLYNNNAVPNTRMIPEPYVKGRGTEEFEFGGMHGIQEYSNGMMHDTRAQFPNRQMNGHVHHTTNNYVQRTDYIEVVSGPPANQRLDPLFINNYPKSPARRALPTGKSTVL